MLQAACCAQQTVPCVGLLCLCQVAEMKQALGSAQEAAEQQGFQARQALEELQAENNDLLSRLEAALDQARPVGLLRLLACMSALPARPGHLRVPQLFCSALGGSRFCVA